MAAARRLGKTEVHGFLASDRRLDFFHSLDLLQFALRLRRFAGLGAKAVGEKLERCDLLLLVLVSRELLFFAGRFLFDVTVPVPAVTIQPPMRDFDDRADEL